MADHDLYQLGDLIVSRDLQSGGRLRAINRPIARDRRDVMFDRDCESRLLKQLEITNNTT